MAMMILKDEVVVDFMNVSPDSYIEYGDARQAVIDSHKAANAEIAKLHSLGCTGDDHEGEILSLIADKGRLNAEIERLKLIIYRSHDIVIAKNR